MIYVKLFANYSKKDYVENFIKIDFGFASAYSTGG